MTEISLSRAFTPRLGICAYPLAAWLAAALVGHLGFGAIAGRPLHALQPLPFMGVVLALAASVAASYLTARQYILPEGKAGRLPPNEDTGSLGSLYAYTVGLMGTLLAAMLGGALALSAPVSGLLIILAVLAAIYVLNMLAIFARFEI